MDAVYVVGAGGIGCAVGHALASVGHPVTFVESSRRKVEAGRRDGVGVEGRAPRPAAFVAFDDWAPPPGARVMLCTKCYDNAAVLPKLPPDALLVPVQNGFDPGLHRHGHAFEGIASFVSECAPDAPSTRITRPGELHLGARSAGTRPVSSADAGFLASLSASLRRACLFRVADVPCIEPFKNAKLMYNAAISPLAAAVGIDNGQLLSLPTARRLFFDLLLENHRILSAAGAPLGKVGPLHPDAAAWILRRRWLAGLMARAFEPSLRGTYCSMARDIETGRTEMENYNGHLIRLARQSGTPCTQNEAVVELVARMAGEGAKPHRGVLDELSMTSGRGNGNRRGPGTAVPGPSRVAARSHSLR